MTSSPNSLWQLVLQAAFSLTCKGVNLRLLTARVFAPRESKARTDPSCREGSPLLNRWSVINAYGT